MNVQIAEKLKHYKPIAFMKGALVLYRHGELVEYNQGEKRFLIKMGTTTCKDTSRLVNRLLRREPKYAVPIDDHRLLAVYQRKLILIDFISNITEIICTPRQGFSDPLNICIASSNWVAIWGEYGNNKDHCEVNIYGLNENYSIEIIYTFPAGEIRHIHNIIQAQDGYYIFTGDNEPHAGIYHADIDFSKITPVAIGSQQYRAVIGFSTSKGLLYATDAVNEKNYIYLLEENSKPTVLAALNGSCIYGRKYGDNYWFSTTVEPDESNRGIHSWFSRKLGSGILSDEVHLVKVSEKLQAVTALKLKKDIYPMKLMQYGSIQFPHGESENVWIYPIAVEKYDGCSLLIGE